MISLLYALNKYDDKFSFIAPHKIFGVMNAVIDKHNRVHRCGIRWPKNSSGLNQCTDCKLIRRVSPLICICTNPTAATLVFVPFI